MPPPIYLPSISHLVVVIFPHHLYLDFILKPEEVWKKSAVERQTISSAYAFQYW